MSQKWFPIKYRNYFLQPVIKDRMNCLSLSPWLFVLYKHTSNIFGIVHKNILSILLYGNFILYMPIWDV